MPSLSDRLTLKHLRLVASVAEGGQLSLAAARLGLSQPAASRALSEIEALIGAPLFARGPKGMVPTELGEGLARRARAILDDLADAAEEVDQLRHGRGGVVRIGAVTGAAVGLVVPAIRALKALAPDVELHVEVGTSEILVADLTALRLDMVLGRLPAIARPGDYALQQGLTEDVRLVANRALPQAGQSVALTDLAEVHWVMQGPGAPIRRAVEEGFLSAGCPLPRNVTNTASLLVVLAMLRSPDVVTPVSAEVAELLVSGATDLVQLQLRQKLQVEPYALITLRDRRLTPVAARCHRLLSDMVRRPGDVRAAG